jgi:hypothetical protein
MRVLVCAMAASPRQGMIGPEQIQTIDHALAAAMVARLAEEVITLDTEIADTETMIEERFRHHRHAEIILSMPGFGVILGAEFLAATGGDHGGVRLARPHRIPNPHCRSGLTSPSTVGLAWFHARTCRSQTILR